MHKIDYNDNIILHCENKKEARSMKNVKRIILVGILFVFVFLSCGLMACGSPHRGDGVTKCRNCGIFPVYRMGYCKSCFEDYAKWRDKNR